MRQIKVTKSITTRDSEVVNAYMREISRYPLLTVDEEVELAQRVHQGDMAARDKLVNSNLRFVISVAKQFPTNESLGLMDLISEGNTGLIKAAERFDETKGFKFISYAVNWIRQSIMKALAEQSSIVYVPSNKQADLRAILRFVALYEQTYEHTPSTEEIAVALDLPEDKVAKTLSITKKHQSIDAPLREGEDGTMVDVMPDVNTESTDSQCLKESLACDLRLAMSALPERDQLVLRYFYGLEGLAPMGLDEISERLGLSHERCRQIREKATRMLRHLPAASSLRTYLL